VVVCWKVAGRLLEGCWKFAGSLLEVCWKVAGSLLEGCLKGEGEVGWFSVGVHQWWESRVL